MGSNAPPGARQAEVERFVSLYDGDRKRAIDSVNAAEHDPTACAVTTMAYVRGPRLSKARKDTSFQIVPILVLGLIPEDGLKSVPPAPFFSVFEIEEIGVWSAPFAAAQPRVSTSLRG
jgi:hypothetical protein